jgi:hypothetical protein
VHFRAEQVIDEQIAEQAGRAPLKVKQMGLHPARTSGSRRDASVVGLQPAKRHNLARTLRLRFGQQIFQLARLVATQARADAVIALDIDIPAQLFTKSRQKFKRRRVLGQRPAAGAERSLVSQLSQAMCSRVTFHV